MNLCSWKMKEGRDKNKNEGKKLEQLKINKKIEEKKIFMGKLKYQIQVIRNRVETSAKQQKLVEENIN